MRARLIAHIMGEVILSPGDEVEGVVAEELVSVGLAVAIEAPKERKAEASPAKAKGSVTRKAI